MTRLYDPEKHETLTQAQWDETTARATLERIVAATVAGRTEEGLWPIHPKDREGQTDLETFTDLYMGAAGVVWALRELSRETKVPQGLIGPEMAERILQAHLERSKALVYQEPRSYLVGEAGVRFFKELLAPEGDNRTRLEALLKESLATTYRELLYGSPGAMLMAHFLAEKTGRPEFKALAEEHEEHLWAEWALDEDQGVYIWSQEFGGSVRHFLGAAHGAVGNIQILLMGLEANPRPGLRKHLVERTEMLLNLTAHVVGDRFANWPVLIDPEAASAEMRVQWCHGAPGVVTSLAKHIHPGESEMVDEWLIKGAELIWQAGPLKKGPSLCHGTAGNGLALLMMFERTGDAIWLDRARAFAMHAIEQVEREVQNVGHHRFSLWTGDLGVALYLRDVLRESGQAPLVDGV